VGVPPNQRMKLAARGRLELVSTRSAMARQSQGGEHRKAGRATPGGARQILSEGQ